MGFYTRIASNVSKVENFHEMDEAVKPFHMEVPVSITRENLLDSMDSLHQEMMLMNSLSGLSNEKMSLHESVSLRHAAVMDFESKKDDFKEVFNAAARKMDGTEHNESMGMLKKHMKTMELAVKPMLNQARIDMIDNSSEVGKDLGHMKLMLSILKEQEELIGKLGSMVSSHKAKMYESMKHEMKLKGFMNQDEWDVEAAINRIKKK